MKRYKSKVLLFLVALLTCGLLSCEDMLNTEDGNAIEPGDHYNNFNDADNAIIGIYGKFMGLADQVIVLNELRADLMDVTSNATLDQIKLNEHRADVSNKYCSIDKFYEVILNCNDALANFDKMLQQNKLSKDDYNYRYSDVMTIRCWVYLQLGIHFGTVPYITDPLVTVDDIKKNDIFPELNFDQLLAKLIECMSTLPFMDISMDSPLYQYNPSGYSMAMILLNKKLMLGDLYLWNNQYVEAATQYNNFFKEAESKLYSGVEYYAYKADGWVWSGSNEPKFQVCYERYKGADLKAYRNKWKEIFIRLSTNSELRQEMITMMSYDASFAPEYPLIELFAIGGKGKYQIKPSAWAIDGLWETQVQANDFVFDGRGRQAAFDWINGQPVVTKYLYDYYGQSTDVNRTINLNYNVSATAKSGRWFLYRAGLLHLRYAEAANRAGYPDLAYALVNNGINAYYDWNMQDTTANLKRANKEGVQYSGYQPENNVAYSVPYPEPFYLDGRVSDPPYASLRSPWCRGYGIRGRVSLKNRSKPEWVVNKQDSIKWMEEAIMEETALECGFEGNRWGDLLRITMRKNKENGSGTAYLNSTIAPKFKAAGKPAPNITPENWFLPYEN